MPKTLVAYYSRAGENYVSGEMKQLKVGNTEVTAGMIAEFTHADLFKIEQTQSYSKSYNECIAQAQEDQRRDARPALKEYPDTLTTWRGCCCLTLPRCELLQLVAVSLPVLSVVAVLRVAVALCVGVPCGPGSVPSELPPDPAGRAGGRRGLGCGAGAARRGPRPRSGACRRGRRGSDAGGAGRRGGGGRWLRPWPDPARPAALLTPAG